MNTIVKISNAPGFNSLFVIYRIMSSLSLTPILKKPGFMSPANRKRVLFSVTSPDRVRTLILNFQRTVDPALYTEVFQGLSKEPEGEQLLWLSQMTECVPLLDRRVDKLVLEFLVSFQIPVLYIFTHFHIISFPVLLYQLQ